MHGSRRLCGAQRTTARLGALALAALLCLLVAAPASGGSLVGKDGKVYACYKTKGKAKGSVRLVAKKAKCRKGEKKVAWSAVGRGGAAGSPGENGSGGGPGEGGAPGSAGLEKQVTNLQGKVESLESKLKGITNLALSEVISKLQGISPTQLQEAIKSVANVSVLNAKVGELCAQTSKLTGQTNALGAVLSGVEVLGKLLFPSVPAALPAFGCP